MSEVKWLSTKKILHASLYAEPLVGVLFLTEKEGAKDVRPKYEKAKQVRRHTKNGEKTYRLKVIRGPKTF